MGSVECRGNANVIETTSTQHIICRFAHSAVRVTARTVFAFQREKPVDNS